MYYLFICLSVLDSSSKQSTRVSRENELHMYVYNQIAGGAPIEKAESPIRSSGFMVPFSIGQSL